MFVIVLLKIVLSSLCSTEVGVISSEWDSLLPRVGNSFEVVRFFMQSWIKDIICWERSKRDYRFNIELADVFEFWSFPSRPLYHFEHDSSSSSSTSAPRILELHIWRWNESGSQIQWTNPGSRSIQNRAGSRSKRSYQKYQSTFAFRKICSRECFWRAFKYVKGFISDWINRRKK